MCNTCRNLFYGRIYFYFIAHKTATSVKLLHFWEYGSKIHSELWAIRIWILYCKRNSAVVQLFCSTLYTHRTCSGLSCSCFLFVLIFVISINSNREHIYPTTPVIWSSCLVPVGGVNRIGIRSRLSATEHFETVLSRLDFRWGLLKTVLSCRQFCSHHRHRKDKTNSLVLSVSVV